METPRKTFAWITVFLILSVAWNGLAHETDEFHLEPPETEPLWLFVYVFFILAAAGYLILLVLPRFLKMVPKK